MAELGCSLGALVPWCLGALVPCFRDAVILQHEAARVRARAPIYPMRFALYIVILHIYTNTPYTKRVFRQMVIRRRNRPSLGLDVTAVYGLLRPPVGICMMRNVNIEIKKRNATF